MSDPFSPDSDSSISSTPESPTSTSSPKKTPSPEENFWLEFGKTLVTAVLLALGIRTFVAEARYIPSESMVPTLKVKDKLIIEKISYHFHHPKRGDIVVFNPTEKLQELHFNNAFIKRIIGTPGDTVEIRDGVVYVNNQPLKENYIAEKPNYQFGPITVPPDSYFVLGDNRNNSYDSHYWGFVPSRNLVGRAVFRFWPTNRIGSLTDDASK